VKRAPCGAGHGGFAARGHEPCRQAGGGERNGDIVPRGLHAATALADGDRLEIVVAVGGG
jgi:hypothetical protein